MVVRTYIWGKTTDNFKTFFYISNIMLRYDRGGTIWWEGVGEFVVLGRGLGAGRGGGGLKW